MAIIEYKDDIFRDTNVLKPNVYFDLGQGCGTIWFNSVSEARKFIEKHGRISGRDSGLCEQCGCHYSVGSKEHKQYPEFACRDWKRIIRGE